MASLWVTQIIKILKADMRCGYFYFFMIRCSPGLKICHSARKRVTVMVKLKLKLKAYIILWLNIIVIRREHDEGSSLFSWLFGPKLHMKFFVGGCCYSSCTKVSFFFHLPSMFTCFFLTLVDVGRNKMDKETCLGTQCDRLGVGIEPHHCDHGTNALISVSQCSYSKLCHF